MHTGFIIMFMVCPLNWVSGLKSHIFLSTMEAKCILFYQYIHEIIGIIEVIKEIQTFVIYGKTQNPKYFTHSKAFVLDDISPSKAYKYNKACLKFSTIKNNLHVLRTLTYHIPYFGIRLKHSKLRLSRSTPMTS